MLRADAKARMLSSKPIGMSGATYEHAKAVVESGNEELIEKMDTTGTQSDR